MCEGFRWNASNIEHATKHGCTIAEIEMVVRREVRGRRDRKVGNGKWFIEGRGIGDRMIRVVFVYDDPGKTTIYVIHAMPLTTRRKRGGRG